METCRPLLLLLFSLVTLVALANGQRGCVAHRELTPVPQFNNLRMLGNWTVFKIYSEDDYFVTPLGECATATIQSGGLYWPITYRKSWIDIDGNDRHKSYITTIDIEHWAIWSGVNDILFPTDLRDSVFVHTDYDNYAIQFSCSEIVGDNLLHQRMTIFTKTRNPDPGLVAVLENLVQTYGFSLDNEIPIDHSNCE